MRNTTVIDLMLVLAVLALAGSFFTVLFAVSIVATIALIVLSLGAIIWEGVNAFFERHRNR